MLHRTRPAKLSVLIVTLLMLTLASSTRAAPSLNPRQASAPYELINAVNALRASYGQPPYIISPILMGTAQAHADYMAATGKVSHTGLGGSSVTDRLLSAGYPLAGDLSLGGFRSENITAGTEEMSAESAVNQWTGDSEHLTTMISPNLTEIGAGVTVYGGRVYYVIDCAQPTGSGASQAAGTPLAGGSTSVPVGGVIIPVIVVTPNASGDFIHEVKAGQTLWQIAISYETKIDEIKRLNNLADNNIYPGDMLLISKGVTMSPTIEPATMIATETLTSFTPSSTPFVLPTTTITLVSAPPSVPRNMVMGVAMGIIALALLGGGLFVRLGSSRKTDINKKE